MDKMTVTDISGLFHSFSNNHENHQKCDISETKPIFSSKGRALRLSQSNVDTSSIRCRLGEKNEKMGISMYLADKGDIVLDFPKENSTARIMLGSTELIISGRPDAIDTRNKTVVEIKSRARRLLGYVPKHERVQCFLYMKMFDFDLAHLVEIFGTQMNVHAIRFKQSEWEAIMSLVQQENP